MNLLDKFVEKTDFADYEDFHDNFRYRKITDFNFGFDVVDEYARVCPDKRALVWCDNHGEERIFTFSEISTLSNKVANMLTEVYGIKKGDVIMSMLNRRYEYYLLNVACCKIGAVVIPATYLLTTKDIAYRCSTANVKLIVCINEEEVLDNTFAAKQTCPSVEYVLTIGEHSGSENFSLYTEQDDVILRPVRSSLSDVMLVYFTSGTTGWPKMVAHNYKYPLGFVTNAVYWQNVQDDGLHFTMAETGWAKFSWGKLYGQWIAGSAVFCYDYFGHFTPTDVLPLIAKYNITSFCAPPTIYRFFIKEDMSKYDFSSLKACSTAGEPLNGEVYRQFKRVTGLKIREGFGQTETAVLCATFKYLDSHPGSMGKPSPNYDIRLMIDGQEVPEGSDGEVVIKLKDDQFGLLAGYYLDDAKTNEIYSSGYYHTGDLARCDKDGYYWFVGRKDDIIKSSGYRIGPFEVESALMEHPSVLECAITAVPDPLRGQIVKATIVLAKGYEGSPELVKELQNHTKKATAPYKYPRIVEFVKELPKTYSGKIQHKEIRKKDSK